MKEKKSITKKNIIMVCMSNLLAVFVSLFMGFILPKKISVENYAYYRIYNLYIGYAGFFHLGLVNGIYLKYGNLDYDKIPTAKFKGFVKCMVRLQIAVVLLLSVFLFFLSGTNNMNENIAWIFVLVNIPLVNIKWFFSSINQFTKRFVIDSYVTIFQNVMNVGMVLLIVVFHLYTYLSILVFTTLINFVCMCIVLYQNKEIILDRADQEYKKEIVELIRTGFFLMLSEFVGIIILGIDSIFVDNFYTLREFAMYSFATSIVAIIFTVINTVSNLVYPYLVRMNSEMHAAYYTTFSNVLAALSMLALTAFYFAKVIIIYWLPAYEESISIAGILFGTIVFRVLITLVCGNYFKVLKMVKEYTVNNIMAIAIAFVFDVAVLVFFKDMKYIAVASVLAFIVWYLITDFTFIKRLGIKLAQWLPRYAFITLNLILFYCLCNLDWLYGVILYVLIVIVTSIIFFYKEVKNLIN